MKLIDRDLQKYFYIVTCLYILIFILSIISAPTLGNSYGVISPEKLKLNAINNTTESSLLSLLPRNILISILIILAGLLGYKLIPLSILAYNAYDFGQIIAAINKPDTINMIYVYFPHAMMEIPAIILCTAFACNFALAMRGRFGGVINILKSKENINPILIKYLIKPYFYYVFPLIILGCIIESTISLYIMRSIFNGS